MRVVAPSGPFEVESFLRGIALLEARYTVEWDRALLGRSEGFLAGSDRVRQEELQAALNAPEVDAIWMARGGYGLSRIAPELELENWASRPRWLVGFSDATVLHLRLNQHGICSLHASNVTGLAALPQEDLQQTFALLEGAEPASAVLTPLNPPAHDFSGPELPPLLGGNLTVLFAEAAAHAASLASGCTLLLEDVSETSYRVDRMLTALGRAGLFDELGAVVLGDFWECSPGRFHVPTLDVLKERLAPLPLPVFADLPAGHGPRNRPLLLGRSLPILKGPVS